MIDVSEFETLKNKNLYTEEVVGHHYVSFCDLLKPVGELGPSSFDWLLNLSRLTPPVNGDWHLRLLMVSSERWWLVTIHFINNDNS